MNHNHSTVKETTSFEGSRRADPYVVISESARKSSSVTSFFQSVLRTIVAEFSAPYGVIYVSYNSHVIEYDWHSGGDDPHLWKPIVHQFLTQSLEKQDASARILNSRDGSKQVSLMSAPIFDESGAVIGSIALVSVSVKESELIERLSVLKGLALFASHVGRLCTEDKELKCTSKSQRDDEYRGISKAAKFGSVEELAFAITNNLRSQFDCEQVAISLVENPNVRLISISGQDNVIRRHPGIIPLLASMEECLDSGEIIVCQKEDEYHSEERVYYLHRQWHSFAKGDSVASIPLEFEGKIVSILSLRRSSEMPFRREELEEIRQKVGQFVPAMILLKRANRSLVGHLKDDFNSALEWIKSPGRYKAKVGIGIGVVFSLWFLFGAMNYEIAVPCTVEPAIVRQISVPSNGILANVFHIAGDKVKRGEVLCEFEHKNLDDKLAQVRAEIAVIEHQIDGYLAKNDSVNVRLLRAQKSLALTKLRIIKRRIEHSIIRSPIDGVIISGDLRRQVGGALSKGDKLFEVASSEKLLVKAQVPETEVDEIRQNLAGLFVPYARPGYFLDMRVRRIYPRAEVINGKNVYVVECEVSVSDDWIKPGMDGTARIDVGVRRPWWIVFHRTIDYLRYKFLL